jgi:hypothetical protein
MKRREANKKERRGHGRSTKPAMRYRHAREEVASEWHVMGSSFPRVEDDADAGEKGDRNS